MSGRELRRAWTRTSDTVRGEEEKTARSYRFQQLEMDRRGKTAPVDPGRAVGGPQWPCLLQACKKSGRRCESPPRHASLAHALLGVTARKTGPPPAKREVGRSPGAHSGPFGTLGAASFVAPGHPLVPSAAENLPLLGGDLQGSKHLWCKRWTDGTSPAVASETADAFHPPRSVEG
jgi:hypothetical protein